MPKNSFFPQRSSEIPAISKLDLSFHNCFEELNACICDDLLSSDDYDFYRMLVCGMICMLVTGECDHLNISIGDDDE